MLLSNRCMRGVRWYVVAVALSRGRMHYGVKYRQSGVGSG